MKSFLKVFYKPREFYQEHQYVKNGLVIFLLFAIVMVNSQINRNYTKAVPADEIMMLVVSALVSACLSLYLMAFVVKQTSKMIGGKGKTAKEHRLAYLLSNIPLGVGIVIMGIGSLFLGMKLFYPNEEKYWSLMTNGEVIGVQVCWYLYAAFGMWTLLNWTVNISELEGIRKSHAFLAILGALLIFAVVFALFLFLFVSV